MSAEHMNSTRRIDTAAVLFIDILGFQAAVDAGPTAIMPVYELLASAFQACDPTGVDAYIAVSDSLIISTQSSETALRFALQIFLNFFYNLGELAKPRGRPVLLRGGLAYDWLTMPFAAALQKEFLKKGGAVNLVGKAYSDAYKLSEKLLDGGPGARLRISEAVYSEVPDISVFPVTAGKIPYYEVEWPTELFRDEPERALPIIRNVRLCIEKLRNEPELLGEQPGRIKKHWTGTLELLKSCASKIQPRDNVLSSILSEEDPPF